jgi:hypothetical protein
MPRQTGKNWISIVQSILKEEGINYFPTRTTSEIRSTLALSEEMQSTTESTFAPPTKSVFDLKVNKQSTSMSYLDKSTRSDSDDKHETEVKSEENKHMQHTTIIRPKEHSNISESQEGSDVIDSDDSIYKSDISTDVHSDDSFLKNNISASVEERITSEKLQNDTPSTFSSNSEVHEFSSTASPLLMPSSSSKSQSCLFLVSLLVFVIAFH